MGFFGRIRNWLAKPAHIDAQGDAEAGADLQEEFGAPDPGKAYLHGSESLAGGAVIPGQAALEATETAEGDVEAEQTPADPDSEPPEEDSGPMIA